MKEFKGTPGRWIKCGEAIVAPGDIEVAVVVNFQDDLEMNADANLIAAAPELLSALQKIVESGHILHHLKIESQWAIAKALGE